MSDRRYAFLPLSKNSSGTAIQNEFMIDYDRGELYINDRGSPKILVGSDEDEYIDNVIYEIMGGDNITLDELSYMITQIISFKNSILGSDGDSSLDFIYSIVKELIDGGINLKRLVDSKESGIGVLSDHNFDNTYISKLDSIDKNANYYAHPESPVCNIRYVKSINGKTGRVTITKDDIGNLNVDLNANRYIHPTLPECNLTDNGVSFLNGMRGVINLNLKSIGINNMKDMGLYNEISQYLHLPTDYDGYSTPKSASVLMDFFLVDIPSPVLAICSIFESKKELASSIYMVGLVGLLEDETPFMYSNITGYISFSDISNEVRGTIGNISKGSVESISNKGIKVKVNNSTHYISMSIHGKVIIDQTHPIRFDTTPTDTGIFYLSGNNVVARQYKYYSKLGYNNETYAIRGGSYKHIAESINHNGRGIISIASDHEAFFAFVDMYGVIRVVFTNRTNRYTHSGRGGMLHDL